MIHRTRPEDTIIHDSGWVSLDDEWEVTAVPPIDSAIKDATVAARLTYADALTVAGWEGADLIHLEHVEALHALSLVGRSIEVPAFTGTPMAERTLEHSLRHDAACWAALARAGWDASRPLPVANFGKHWVHGAPSGRSWLMGWWVDDVRRYGSSRRGPGFVQGRPVLGSLGPHDDRHHDDGTTTMLVRRRRQVGGLGRALAGVGRMLAGAGRLVLDAFGTDGAGGTMGKVRSTARLGSRGEDVRALQEVLGLAPADGVFGPATDAALRSFQRGAGLVEDGVAGERTWLALGQRWAPSTGVGDAPVSIVSPAVRAALRDANAAWPGRQRQSDGTLGDAAHQARKSDHNTGDAVDITHDPRAGCDAGVIADMATRDHRVTYVIWDRRIWSRARAAEGWRPYTGSNPHTKHVHISVRADARDDALPWPWAPR